MSRTFTARSLVLGAITLLLALAPLSSVSAATTDRMPDLGFGRLRDFSIDTPGDGRRLFRFTAQIVNIGIGPFEVVAQRTTTSPFNAARESCNRPYYNAPFHLQQRIYNSNGGFRTQYTPFTLCWGGDGHNHWHMRYLERYELLRLDRWSQPVRSAKSGFCFFDNAEYLPDDQRGAQFYVQQPPVSACRQGNTGATEVKFGLTDGWGDDYHASLPDQFVDITGLQPGRYRLKATADPSNWLRELREDNNTTWVDLDLTSTGFTIVSFGPTAHR